MGNTSESRRVLQGIVVSSKMDKTITVEVRTYKTHPIYKKRVQYRKKFKAHDERNEAKEGDTVVIAACRPIAKTVKFRLIKVLKQGE